MIGAIIQARMGSSRLPGKVLADIGGQPMLAYVVGRVRHARKVGTVVVATSLAPADDGIAQWCGAAGVACFRGDEHDVLDRYHATATAFQLDVVVRLTADCPLLDPQVIDDVIDAYAGGEFDYVSNTLVPTYPDGLDTEVVRRGALDRAWSEATLVSEREHVLPYIWKRPEMFRLKNVARQVDLSHLRWTVDEPEDLEFVRRVYAHFDHRIDFGMDAVLALLGKDPALSAVNQGFTRNEGYERSLQADVPGAERGKRA